MATNAQPADDVPRLRGRTRSSVLQTLHGSSSHRNDLRTRRLDQIETLKKRRSPALRSAAQNVESFNRNREQSTHSLFGAAPEHGRQHMRTRSIARTETTQRQEQARPEPVVVEPMQPVSAPEPPPRGDFGAWRPSIVIGSALWLDGEDLSAIEIANRKVAQTRLWAQHYHGVPGFARKFQEAIRERQQLDETAEVNTKPR